MAASEKKEKEEWKPPKWMHTLKISDTSFLNPKKLHHGKLLEKEEKEVSERKPVPVQRHEILAVIQIQEFEELFDELFDVEQSKLRLIRSTSKEIDSLRQRIMFLSGTTMKNNPSKSHYFASFFSFFSSAPNEDKFEPCISAKFSNPDAMEQRIKQIKRTKIALIQQTSSEIDQLRQIITCLEHINGYDDKGTNVATSKWNALWMLLAAVAIGFTAPIL